MAAPTCNLAYAPWGERGLLDVLLPPGEGPFPVVVCLHGGGWREGSKEGARPLGEALAQLGLAVVLPNYRLTGTHPHPAQEDDVCAALRWVVARSGEYPFMVSRLGLAGTSAGGHLAALVGAKAGAGTADAPPLRAVMPFCPVTDVVRWAQELPQYRGHVVDLLGGPPESRAAAARDCSPICQVRAGLPPFYFVHGMRDTVVPVGETQRMVAALRAVGVPAEMVLPPEAGHGLALDDLALDPRGGQAPGTAFLRRHLLPEPSAADRPAGPDVLAGAS